MSTYNRAKDYLPKAIDSVRRQKYQNWQLIVVDDCSTDETEQVVNDYNNKKIKYVRLDKNSGSDTLPKNTGIKLARTKYICFVDDDVQLRPNHLEVLVKAMEKDPSLDVAYSDMWIMPNDEAGIAHDFDTQFLLLRNFIDTSSAIVKRSVLYEVGGFDQTLKKFIDWNLWVRIMKLGKKFKRVPTVTFDYYIHKDTKSNRVKTETYMHPKLGRLFVPTFDPSGCKIHVGYLGEAFKPSVAVFTIHYDRPEYSKQSYREMVETAGYPFDWYCYDNGGTSEVLNELKPYLFISKGENVGITKASNDLIEHIKNNKKKYDIIIKIDNDVEFETYDWLKDVVDMWERNRMVYISPYVEGLYHNPGGARRIGSGMIGDEYVEVTNHIGGIFAAIDAKAYDSFRWADEMLHGDQDAEASLAFRKMGYMPCYYPRHRIVHRDSTFGQWNKHKDYFERRKREKTTKG